jgi:hypothetical protein
MNKRQARKLVIRAIVRTLEANIDHGAEFLRQDEDGSELKSDDQHRMQVAAEEFAAELREKYRV